MRRRYIFLLFLVFIVACSNHSDGAVEKEQPENDGNQVSEEPSITTEVLYTYEHENSGDYSIQSVKTDSEGTAVIFTGNEDIDRKSDYYTYVVDRNNEVIEGLELANDKEQERRCVDLNLSPNGNYMVYDCHDDGIEFSIYDMETEEIIHQVPEADVYVQDVLGVSDDLTVYLETSNEDSETELTLYDVESKTYNHYELAELFDIEYPSLNKITPTDDGKQILIDIVEALYLFDTETEEVSEIVNVESYQEEYDSDGIFVYNARLSPDGKYLHYVVAENTSDPVYSEYFFKNLESGEIDVYGEFDYTVGNFDIHGNLLLSDTDNLYLYNLDSKETLIIPEIEVSVYSSYFTISPNGKFLIYTDKESNEDDTYTQYLYRVSLGDISSYEIVELRVQKEKEREEVGQDEITLTEASFDEKDNFLELWESSTSVMFPTKFSEKVLHKTNHYSGEYDGNRYSQTIFLDTTSFKRNEIEFTAITSYDGNACPFFDDLEVVDTIDGIDYYFYDYKNADVEAGVSIDDICYYIDAEDHTEEEMLLIAQSLAPIDSSFHKISVDQLRFPTKFPIGNPEPSSPRVIAYQDGEMVDYLIDYRGESDNDIKMELEIRNNEPNLYMNEKNGTVVDVDGWDEAYFTEDYMQLHLYDGTYYYIIELEISKDLLEVFGSEHVEEVFLEIGESIK